LSDHDRDNIRTFQFLLTSNISCSSFNHMHHIFQHKVDINSEYVIYQRMRILSGVIPVMYDCCPGGCIAFLAEYIHHQSYPHCGEACFQPNGKPCRQYAYYPLIPRLQGLLQSPETSEKMSYRAHYEHKPGNMSDVFDGNHYQ
ncbi:hypothetical protein HD554DRAFT_2030172, partial [Boletus coccyginus]